jgi:hypothetical protein
MLSGGARDEQATCALKGATMRHSRLLAGFGVVAVLALVSAGPAHSKDRVVLFQLEPLNHSGATALATVTVQDDGSLQIRIQGHGLTPNQPHAQHIHGDETGSMEFTCPTPNADDNGDGQVSTEEGIPQYGTVVVSLTTKGDTSAASGLALDRFPVADANGDMDYERTIPADQVPDPIVEHIDHLHIVQHGLDVNGNGKYDMKSLGESVFAKSLGVDGVPEEGTNPTTCGEVVPIGSVDTGGGATDEGPPAPLLAVGGVALAAAAGAFWLRRRLGTSV